MPELLKLEKNSLITFKFIRIIKKPFKIIKKYYKNCTKHFNCLHYFKKTFEFIKLTVSEIYQ